MSYSAPKKGRSYTIIIMAIIIAGIIIIPVIITRNIAIIIRIIVAIIIVFSALVQRIACPHVCAHFGRREGLQDLRTAPSSLPFGLEVGVRQSPSLGGRSGPGASALAGRRSLSFASGSHDQFCRSSSGRMAIPSLRARTWCARSMGGTARSFGLSKGVAPPKAFRGD